jgi:hypothetical protein
MAEMVLFRDTFDGPAGPLSEHTPDVGYRPHTGDGSLDGNGRLVRDVDPGWADFIGGSEIAPPSIAALTATLEGSGAVSMEVSWPVTYYVGDDEYSDEARVGVSILSPDEVEVYYANIGAEDYTFQTVEFSTPETGSVVLRIDIGPAVTTVSVNGSLVAALPELNTGSLSTYGLSSGPFVGAYLGPAAGYIADVSLTSSEDPEDPEDPVDPPAPLKVGMSAGFDSSWEAEQEIARAMASTGPVDVLIRVDFTGPAQELPDTDIPAPTHSGVSNAVYYVQGMEGI